MSGEVSEGATSPRCLEIWQGDTANRKQQTVDV